MSGNEERGKTMPRSISTIAREISAVWPKPYFAAVPYLEAMRRLDSMRDSDWHDSARSIVTYFLSNASQWKGDDARRIKAELKAMLQGA
jgi:hypothetical protein